MTANRGDLWVFGYGSLIWRPGFDFEERTLATIWGYRRALCVYSHVHRGSPERPGLVVGLDRGGACRGVAFRVAAARRETTIAYLREREQVTLVYHEADLRAVLADGRRVVTLAYIVDQHHPQYAGRLPVEELARLVRQGVGVSGNDVDYVRSTYEHLATLGIEDRTLAAVVEELDANPAQSFAAAAEGGAA
ncbi:MAG TPA: gamma-glutamylcyclotransferase [Beijerinckiaceae bacterium]|nr:gamma-glutamylcyclotransferase [Beijerinckiaceae bacterium]